MPTNPQILESAYEYGYVTNGQYLRIKESQAILQDAYELFGKDWTGLDICYHLSNKHNKSWDTIHKIIYSDLRFEYNHT